MNVFNIFKRKLKVPDWKLKNPSWTYDRSEAGRKAMATCEQRYGGKDGATPAGSPVVVVKRRLGNGGRHERTDPKQTRRAGSVHPIAVLRAQEALRLRSAILDYRRISRSLRLRAYPGDGR
jgi:hypothetical protein